MNFDNLNDDAIIAIITKLPLSDLPKMAIANKRIASILRGDKFWYQKIKNDFPHEKETTLNSYFRELGSYEKTYKKLLTTKKSHRKWLKTAHEDITDIQNV